MYETGHDLLLCLTVFFHVGEPELVRRSKWRGIFGR